MMNTTFSAMGSRIEIWLDAEGTWAQVSLARTQRLFEEWEQALSRFRPESELSLLNNRPEEWVKVSRTLWAVICLSVKTANESQGLINPGVYDALVQSGYDRSFGSFSPDLLPVARRITRVDNRLDEILFDQERMAIWLPGGLHLDLGGIGKGWAAHQTMLRLKKYGPVMVNAGGDIAISDIPRAGQPWAVGITNPFEAEKSWTVIKGQKGGIATSGQDYRRWLANGIWQHHLIDPRSGLPAQTDLITVTVFARTVMRAEAAAKQIFILGSQDCLPWLKQKNIPALLILKNGQIQYKNGFEDILWR